MRMDLQLGQDGSASQLHIEGELATSTEKKEPPSCMSGVELQLASSTSSLEEIEIGNDK